MTKKLLVAACLIHGMSLLAMKPVPQPHAVQIYYDINNTDYSNPQNDRISVVFMKASSLTPDELESSYFGLKRHHNIGLLSARSRATNSTLFETIIVEGDNPETLESYLRRFSDDYVSLILEAIKRQEEIINSKYANLTRLINWLKGRAQEIKPRKLFIRGGKLLVLVGLMFGSYKLFNYCTTDKTAKS